MATILDKAANLASVYGASYATFVPAVTSGLQVYSLFGGTQAASLLNSAPSGSPSTIGAGTPVFQSPSGVQIGNTTLGRINTSYTDVGGSMTVMVVGQTPALNIGSFSSSETTNATSMFSMRFSPSNGSFFGCTLCLGYNNAAGATSLTVQGAASNSTAVMTQLALPNFFIAKADLTNNLGSITCPTAPSILTGGTTHFAGSAPFSRPSVGNPMCVGSASGVELSATSQSTVHAIVIFNRVTTSAEDSLMYNQMKAIMASRGITI